jgi:hypothetical protein
VAPSTVKLARRMMYECSTRDQLRDYVLQVYDEQPDLTLPHEEDQLYFITVLAYRCVCGVYRSLNGHINNIFDRLAELYRAQNNNFEVLRQFWGLLKKENEEFAGFKWAVKSPLHLARLFEIFFDEGRWPAVDRYAHTYEAVKTMCKHAPQTAEKVFLKCFKDLLIDNPLVTTFESGIGDDQMDIRGGI